MKDQIITNDLEGKLTDVWETVSGDFLESVFYELISRLEWVIEHEGE
jgi:hypothetical protein